jgi:hypothetical protein
MRRALVVMVIGSLLVTAGSTVAAASGAPSPTRLASVAAQAVQVDFNGDDFDDLAIGVPNEDVGGQVNAGAVNILYGSAGGLTGTNQLLTQASAEDGDQFGASVAKGDFNNDTFIDLAVGAPGETLAGDAGAGAVNVFFGSASGLAATSQVLVQANPEAGDRFGASLGVGRFDTSQGQTASQLAVGAPGEDLGATLNTGAINILYGADTGLVGRGQVLVQGSQGVADTAESDDSFGGTLTGRFSSNDFNGDGLSDLAIGAAREDVGTTVNAGAVNVLFGSTTGFPPATGGQFFTQDSAGIADTAEPGDGFGTALD